MVLDMHGGAYGRVRGGGGGAGNAPRLVIGFALVMAVAAFLSWCVSAKVSFHTGCFALHPTERAMERAKRP
jgi:hypothetical protein